MADFVDPFDPKPAASSDDGFVDPFAQAPARALTPAPAADTGPGDFARGFKRTLPEPTQLAGGTLAAVGDVAGAEVLRDYGLDVYQEKERKLPQIGRATCRAIG